MKTSLPRILFLFPAALLLLGVASPAPGPHTQMSAHLHVRQLRDSSVLEYEVEMLCRSDGECITHFLPPNDYYILTGPDGDMRLYNPVSNELRITRDTNLVSGSHFFTYLLQGKTLDMDLPGSGFSQLYKTGMEDKEIVFWENAARKRSTHAPNRVTLVYQDGHLAFMGYMLPNDKFFKRNFYRNYTTVDGMEVPTAITEYNYFAAADSLIVDTEYSDFAFDEHVNPSLLHFTLPLDAIVR